MQPEDEPNDAPREREGTSHANLEPTPVVSITALRPRGAKGSYFTVELSNGEGLRLRSETVASRGLNVGDVVDTAAILVWQCDESNRRAVETGLNFVSYRPRSSKEVADHLRKKSFDVSARDHAIGRLQELGYLDDAAFARFWVESRDTHRPRGRMALAWELRQKGVAEAVIEDALARFGSDETTLAREAARKRATTLKTADSYKFRQQLGAFLARRGFSYDVIEEVVDDLWKEQDADDCTRSNQLDT